MTAASAPSVATIGATTDTLPIATAAYARLRPRRNRCRSGEQPEGERRDLGRLGTHGREREPDDRPTSITQPMTTREPIIRLEREETRVAVAHSTAAPRPPMMAIMGQVWRQCGCRVGGGLGRPTASREGCGTIRLRARSTTRSARSDDHPEVRTRFAHLAKTPRTWTGARTPSASSVSARPRAAAPSCSRAEAPRRRRREGPDGRGPARRRHRRSDRRPAEALSALDRAAKAGAIHPNAAARRKSRLTRKVNAALGGASLQSSAQATKVVGKAAAAKAAKARIAAGKAGKAKGAQTAAGKARAALSKTARAEAAAAKAAAEASAATAAAGPKPAAKTATKAPTKAKAATKTTAKAAAEGGYQEGCRAAQGHGQGRAEGEEARRRPSSRRATPPVRHDERPGHRPGRFDSRPSGRRLSPGDGRARSAAGRGLGRKVPYSAAPRRPPSVVRRMIVPAVPNCPLQ